MHAFCQIIGEKVNILGHEQFQNWKKRKSVNLILSIRINHKQKQQCTRKEAYQS